MALNLQESRLELSLIYNSEYNLGLIYDNNLALAEKQIDDKPLGSNSKLRNTH